MWNRISQLILNNRALWLIIIGIITVFMGWKASQVQLSFSGKKVLPSSDSAFIKYTIFKKTFGEDGTVMVLGIQSDKLFNKDQFEDWYDLGRNIQAIKGIKGVLSVGNLFELGKDTVNQSFVLQPLSNKKPQNQAEVDSLRKKIGNLLFYKGLILNPDKHATLMAITFDPEVMNSPARNPVIKKIDAEAKAFQEKHKTTVHISGLPYIRTVVSNLVANEFVLFLGLSILISAIILFLFFRTAKAVVYPLIVVIIGVVWSLGTMVLFNYDITLLTGLIPPLIVVIGIPNSIFILNKYYHETGRGEVKEKALYTSIHQAGVTTFIANLNTSIGFFVLYFTNSEILMEFGLVASINIMATFALSLILIPIIFSFLADPGKQSEGMTERPFLKNLLDKTDQLVTRRRPAIYIFTTILVAVAAYGMTRITINGYVVDDLPKNNPVYRDLKFFESNFDGVLPLEVQVDTRKNNGVMRLSTIRKMDELEDMISSYPEFSRPISLTQALKYSTQAFYGGDSSYYRLPTNMEQNFILQYAANSGKGNKGAGSMLKSFLDSTRRSTRITFQMADVGSNRMNTLLAELKPRIDSIFNPKNYSVLLTGSSVIFVKGTNYLVRNLYESLALAIVLISLIRLIQFRSLKIILLSLIPNIIPLIITAGIMGYLGIQLKPSTILTFSIALGIASDQTIYFLTRYRQELWGTDHSISSIVSHTIRETGVSMIYIGVVLFFGFGIFAVSTFGGTVALGILMSITLLMAVVSNLVVLPALLLSLERRKEKSGVKTAQK
ncbi:MAG: MMPL family transporter [Mucilaginibacter polytrichastri]|nr:MMPL family transporter [Mucilaginibacter polytrichastri]